MSQSITPSPFIPRDGYSLQGYIKAVEGFYPAVRFTYRRMSMQTLGEMETQMGKLPNNGAKYRFQADVVFKVNLLLRWDVVDANGKAVECTADNLFRLFRPIFTAIIGIITGYEASDLDEDAPHKQESPSDLLANIGAESETDGEEADAKNSGAGCDSSSPSPQSTTSLVESA